MENSLMENALKYFFTFCLKLEEALKEKDLIGTSSNGKDSKVQSSNFYSFQINTIGKFACSSLLALHFFKAYQVLKSVLKSGEIKYFLGCLGSVELGRQAQFNKTYVT